MGAQGSLRACFQRPVISIIKTYSTYRRFDGALDPIMFGRSIEGQRLGIGFDIFDIQGSDLRPRCGTLQGEGISLAAAEVQDPFLVEVPKARHLEIPERFCKDILVIMFGKPGAKAVMVGKEFLDLPKDQFTPPLICP